MSIFQHLSYRDRPTSSNVQFHCHRPIHLKIQERDANQLLTYQLMEEALAPATCCKDKDHCFEQILSLFVNFQALYIKYIDFFISNFKNIFSGIHFSDTSQIKQDGRVPLFNIFTSRLLPIINYIYPRMAARQGGTLLKVHGQLPTL